jgi:hypothetical protein
MSLLSEKPYCVFGLWLSFFSNFSFEFAHADTTNLGTGAPSFDAFVSAGAISSVARDAGGVFINPASLTLTNASLMSHSLVGYSNFSFEKIKAENSWSSLGLIYKPTINNGRFLVAGGYYNPDGVELDQGISIDSESLPSTTVWHSSMKMQDFSRRGGLALSLIQSPRTQWGVALVLPTDASLRGMFST